MNKENNNSISKNTTQIPKNNLKDEISPYLLQHVHNPVNWYPWNDLAFAIAEKENKPIFLSIGYSTCHWCHVMEKESFEDAEVAELMNKNFINIKVDREERPDLDTIYMEVLQNMTGYGGWPMTILLTPQKKPFFAGTYFPKNDLGNRIGMKNLISRIKEAWEESYFEIIESSNEIVNHIIETNSFKNNDNHSKELDLDEVTKNGYKSLIKSIDKTNGGFGFKPKFPNPQNLLFLLNYSVNNNFQENINLIDLTLSKMQSGGINDQIGGGFHRYSTDEKWILPHFEKMLYDNAQLISIYSKTGLICNNKDFLEVSINIYNFLKKEFLLEENLISSSIDADSENKEGKFYVWEYNELLDEFNNFKSINNLKSTDDKNSLIINDLYFELYTLFYNIDKNGNFEDESSRIIEGTNILYVSDESINITNKKLNEFNIAIDDFYKIFLTIFNDYLYSIRNNRIKPFLDQKAQTNWNCLLINGLLDLFNNLKQFKSQNIQNNTYTFDIIEDEILILATNIYSSIFNNLFFDSDLYHYYLDGKVKSKAFLDDYAYLIESGIKLYKNTLDKVYLDKSINLLEFVIKNFYDEVNGGFYNSQYNNDLILNKKEIIDNTMPSGNSVMLQNLDYFYKITSNIKYKEIYELTLNYFSVQLSSSPAYFCSLLNYFTENNSSVNNTLLIIVIKNEEEELQQIVLNKNFSLNNNIVLINLEKNNELNTNENMEIKNLIVGYENYKLINELTTYYYCDNFYCEKPTIDINEILRRYNH